MSTINVQELKEKLRELELIQQTLKKLPGNRKVLREVEGRLIEHNIRQTLPAIQQQIAVVLASLKQGTI